MPGTKILDNHWRQSIHKIVSKIQFQWHQRFLHPSFQFAFTYWLTVLDPLNTYRVNLCRKGECSQGENEYDNVNHQKHTSPTRTDDDKKNTDLYTRDNPSNAQEDAVPCTRI